MKAAILMAVGMVFGFGTLTFAQEAAPTGEPAKKELLFKWGTCVPLTPEVVVVGGDLKSVKPAVRAEKLDLSVTAQNDLVVDLKGSALLNDNGKMVIDNRDYSARYRARWVSSIGGDYTEFLTPAFDNVEWMRFTVEKSEVLNGQTILTVNTLSNRSDGEKTWKRYDSSRYACKMNK